MRDTLAEQHPHSGKADMIMLITNKALNGLKSLEHFLQSLNCPSRRLCRLAQAHLHGVLHIGRRTQQADAHALP